MKLTLAKKMTLLGAAAALGVALLSGISVQQMNKVYEATNYANVNSVPSILALDGIRGNFSDMRALVLQVVIASNDADIREYEQKITATQSKLDDLLKAYDTNGCLGTSCVSDDKEKAELEALRSSVKNYAALFRVCWNWPVPTRMPMQWRGFGTKCPPPP